MVFGLFSFTGVVLHRPLKVVHVLITLCGVATAVVGIDYRVAVLVVGRTSVVMSPHDVRNQVVARLVAVMPGCHTLVVTGKRSLGFGPHALVNLVVAAHLSTGLGVGGSHCPLKVFHHLVVGCPEVRVEGVSRLGVPGVVLTGVLALTLAALTLTLATLTLLTLALTALVTLVALALVALSLVVLALALTLLTLVALTLATLTLLTLALTTLTLVTLVVLALALLALALTTLSLTLVALTALSLVVLALALALVTLVALTLTALVTLALASSALAMTLMVHALVHTGALTARIVAPVVLDMGLALAMLHLVTGRETGGRKQAEGDTRNSYCCNPFTAACHLCLLIVTF